MILWSTAFVAEFFKASSSAGGVRDTHEHIPDQVVQILQNSALGQVYRFLEVMVGLDKVVVFFHAVPMSALFQRNKKREKYPTGRRITKGYPKNQGLLLEGLKCLWPNPGRQGLRNSPGRYMQ